MPEQPKIFSVTRNGEYRGAHQGPGNCARAVEEILGNKARGKDNIAPKLAKLKPGECLDLKDGIKIFRVRPVEEQRETPSQPLAPAQPVNEPQPMPPSEMPPQPVKEPEPQNPEPTKVEGEERG